MSADAKRVQLGAEPGASALAILVREAVKRRGGEIIWNPDSPDQDQAMSHDELKDALREVLDEAEVHAVFEIRMPA